VAQQGRAGQLPFEPEEVGSHWSRRVQVDVVAVNWRQQAILLGECKWGTDRVRPDTIRELIDNKMPLLLHDLPDGGEGWRTHHAFFSRAGFTQASRSLAQSAGALLVNLDRLERGLVEE
jgi:hypothetical protein